MLLLLFSSRAPAGASASGSAGNRKKRRKQLADAALVPRDSDTRLFDAQIESLWAAKPAEVVKPAIQRPAVQRIEAKAEPAYQAPQIAPRDLQAELLRAAEAEAIRTAEAAQFMSRLDEHAAIQAAKAKAAEEEADLVFVMAMLVTIH